MRELENNLILPLANLSPQKIVKSREWGELRHLTTRDIMGSHVRGPSKPLLTPINWSV